MRNDLWSSEVEKYSLQVLEACPNCQVTALPKPARKVSLSSLSREFNMVVSVDYLFIDDTCIFHIMDTKSQYSVGSVV